MRKTLRTLTSAAALAAAMGAVLVAGTGTAEARRGSFFLGIGLPPIVLGPPAYYYPAPPPPPAYGYPPPGYYTQPPPCRARYDWRWDGYNWRQVYVGCW